MRPARIEGDLEHGLQIGEKIHKHFVLEEVDTGAMFDAEEIANPQERPMAYRAALLTFQLKKLGDFEGPFNLAMLRRLKPQDFADLADAQQALGQQGAEIPKA